MSKTETVVEIVTKDGIELEARMCRGTLLEGAVLCHPHSLYGGTMDNNVVLAARDALEECGFSTLRFNFRGVGRSEGSFGNGDGESLDVASACKFLKSELGLDKIHVAAYSFGSWVSLKAITSGLQVASVALIAPPISFSDFGELSLPHAPSLIALGDTDEFCSQSDLDGWLKRQSTDGPSHRKVVFQNTDHFFYGKEAPLKEALIAFFSK